MARANRPVAASAERRHKSVAAGFVQLQAFLAKSLLGSGDRLPPERELCHTLGLSRTELRKALSVAENEGLLWRHVGKGTFLGARPSEELSGISSIAVVTNPLEVMRVRILLEPGIAREAAFCANAADLQELDLCLRLAPSVVTWRQAENWDNRFHRALAEATHNRLLLSLFDALNSVRRTVVWAAKRDPAGMPPIHNRFEEHVAITGAVKNRDGAAAARLMRAHLEAVLLRMTRFEDE